MKGQIRPPKYLPSRKPLYLIIILTAIAILFIIIILTIISSRRVVTNPSLPNPTNTQVTLFPSVAVSSVSAEINTRLLVYLREGNIWTVKTDGTSLRQITRDAYLQNNSYLLPQIKEKNEIIFGNCLSSQSQCLLKNKNLETGDEKVILEPKMNISAFSGNKDLLAFIGIATQSSSLYFFNQGISKKIIDFQPNIGRERKANDEISITFSPDNKHLLVINTITQLNKANDPTTIWVLDRTGNITTKINSATNAFWLDNNILIYNNSTNIWQKNIFGTEEKLADLTGNNYSLSPDKKKLLYWKINPNGTTTVNIYSLETKTDQEVVQGFAYPKWLDNKTIIGIKTTPNKDAYLGFATNGLIVYNLETKEERILDSNSSIFQFIIQQ